MMFWKEVRFRWEWKLQEKNAPYRGKNAKFHQKLGFVPRASGLFLIRMRGCPSGWETNILNCKRHMMFWKEVRFRGVEAAGKVCA
jgi:hypothetical protein